MPMSRTLLSWLAYSSLIASVLAGDLEFSACDCDAEGFWSTERILHVQKVSDCLIATAYFSIPLELIYFVSCSHLFPFKWILFQFVAFIVLCGLSHLLTVFTYKSTSFFLMLSLTIAKFLTALVSFATAITLLTLIPQLLRVKVRENLLRTKAQDLDRRIEMMKLQEERSCQVRLLTQEIRKSLDRHVILSTTVVELSRILGLQNCAVWMPNEAHRGMNLTHESTQTRPPDSGILTISKTDRDVIEIAKNNRTVLLSQDSLLGFASSGRGHQRGPAAAIRMPLLKACDFKGGAPAATAVEASSAILVLVLPEDSPDWRDSELGIIAAVADQVAVALLHAGVLEESQRMREKLEEQNQALHQARIDATLATRAKNSFQKVASHGMRRPLHSILSLLSIIQQETLNPEMKLVVNTMSKTSSVISALIGDVMDIPDAGSRSLVLETRPFHLHATIRESAAVIRYLCDSRRSDFDIQVEPDVPNLVYGDEKRIFQVILHVAGELLGERDGGSVCFSVRSESSGGGGGDSKLGQRWLPSWKPSIPADYAGLRFEIVIKGSKSPAPHLQTSQRFSMCRKVVQMMEGDIRMVYNRGLLLLRLRRRRSGESSDYGVPRAPSPSMFEGLRVLLADGDNMNRATTKKLLKKLGCHVDSVASGYLCLSFLNAAAPPFDLLLLDVLLRDVDAFLLASDIRNFRGGNWPLVVAMAASSQESTWERCLQSGIHGLVLKPFSLQTMADELCRVLRVS